jgi:sugar phosphate isomerase/epimerase
METGAFAGGRYNVLYLRSLLMDGVGEIVACRLLGEGDSDFYGTMRVLRERNYKGWLYLENYYDRLPLRNLAPREYISIIRKDLDILKAAIDNPG